jgi:hypothetical protein
MKHAFIVFVFAIGMLSAGLVTFAGGARAHEQEVSVDWDVAYANIQVLGPPVYTYFATQTVPLTGSGTPYVGVLGAGPGGGWNIISMKTGEFLRIDWSFRYVAATVVRGDLFWITRLGLDFATIGRYINGQWIGASSFELTPNTRYDATVVLRSIQPTYRHLHVGVSVQNVGNIPTAPTVAGRGGLPPMPTLYGAFTDASGPVTEPVMLNVPGFGTVGLLAPWPWAVGSLAAQIVIGFVFIGIMWWYGRYTARKEAKQ